MTSINYEEDIDSLRFALSLIDYNLEELRPHFPGYPVFCIVCKFIYYFTNSVKYTFSIIGGLSTFIIIYYSIKINRILFSDNKLILLLLIFFNPLLWNLSNRYMSDIFGLAIIMINFYYLINLKNNYSEINIVKCVVLTGLLIGVRVSFLPFIIPLYLFILNKIRKKLIFKILFYFSFSVLIWLVPLIAITGLDNFLNIAQNHINGHFNKWGGGILSSNASYYTRIIKIFESIWADGLGGWWFGRNWITFLSGIFNLIFIFSALKKVKKEFIKIEHIQLILCLLTYLIWVFLFQNIVYKPRHVIIFIPFVLLIINSGIFGILRWSKVNKFLISIYFLSLIFITSFLNWQHSQPSAIYQIKKYLFEKKDEKIVFYSTRLKNNYFKQYQGSEDIIFIDKNNLESMRNYYNSKIKIYSTIYNKNMNLKKKISFFHNPYVNRLWPKLNLYIYEM